MQQPPMPVPLPARKHLKEAQAPVNASWQARSIRSRETRRGQAYRECLCDLHHIAAPLRHAGKDQQAERRGSEIESGKSR